ncbi:hypothetical protein CEXT_745151 [Caerostris extrusa]|uniref:Uncharacterized protein n=1 Tax=Caerostris extrusa TaxID=172846 RepID=A0AAV4VV46_CAEEX|nr:hypothetical protein CEXT_745151 [Caerostris extrusa]
MDVVLVWSVGLLNQESYVYNAAIKTNAKAFVLDRFRHVSHKAESQFRCSNGGAKEEADINKWECSF